MSIESDRDARYLRLFRQSARSMMVAAQLDDDARARAEEKAARAYYEELGISAKYDAEIFLAEMGR